MITKPNYYLPTIKSYLHNDIDNCEVIGLKFFSTQCQMIEEGSLSDYEFLGSSSVEQHERTVSHFITQLFTQLEIKLKPRIPKDVLEESYTHIQDTRIKLSETSSVDNCNSCFK